MMAKKKNYNNSIEIKNKKQQCNNFLKLICIGGITIPLLIHIIIIGEPSRLLTAIAVLTALSPTLFAYFSRENYDWAASNSETPDSNKKEKKGDMLLYIGGILSIIFIAIYIGLSEGVRNHIMAYYFVFIPSATAVAFRTKNGLRFVSGISAICLTILYVFFYEKAEIVGEPDELLVLNLFSIPHKFLHLIFALYQIILIVWLEHKTNKLQE